MVSKRTEQDTYLWDLIDLGVKKVLHEHIQNGEIKELLQAYHGDLLSRETPVPYHALLWLRKSVEGEAFASVSPKGIRLGFFHDLPKIPPSARVLVADASALPYVASRIVGRELVTVAPEPPANLAVVSVRVAVSKFGASKDPRKLERALGIFERLLKKVPEGKKIVVFCHKAFKSRVQASCREILGDKVDWKVLGHFGDRSRGSNEFSDYDAVFVLLRPVMEPSEKWAFFHYFGMDEEQKAEYLEHHMLSELQQEVYRLRPLQAEKPKIAVVIGDLDDWMIEKALKPVFHASFSAWADKRKTLRAARMLICFGKAFGFIDMAIAVSMGIGRKEQLPSREKREFWWKAIEECFPEKFERFLASLGEFVSKTDLSEAEKVFEKLNKEGIPTLVTGTQKDYNLITEWVPVNLLNESVRKISENQGR